MYFKNKKEECSILLPNVIGLIQKRVFCILMLCLTSCFSSFSQKEGYYFFESEVGHNKVLGIAGGSRNGTGINISDYDGGLNQVFYLRKVGDTEYFTIESVFGRGIHVYRANKEPKAKVTLWDVIDQNNLKWKFIKSKSGNSFHIQSKLGTYLDVQWGNSKSGTPVWMWSFNGGKAQKWYLRPFINLKFPFVKMTDFSPKKHGFNFSNSFKSTIGDSGSISFTFNGLCGGMSYAANDYYSSKKKVPRQNYQPAIGTPLHNYIYERQQNSFANLIKFVEMTPNPFGWRDHEFFYWGLEGRFFELKRRVDQNKTIPLGLFNVHNDPVKHHQVLAIGYNLGRYKGFAENDPHKKEVRIFIYDPNYPNKLSVLVPVPSQKCYYQFAGEIKNGKLVNVFRVNKRWRSYFIDDTYKFRNPPSITEIDNNLKPHKIYSFLLELRTGGDDLRGGHDNVHVHVNLKNGKKITQYNVNKKRRWPDNHTQFVEIKLREPIRKDQIKDIKLQTTFGGGPFGDNWNLNYLKVTSINGSGKKDDLYEKGANNLLLKRFTGDSQWFSAIIKQ
ncbi:RICIN domain-containing protein [Aquimarina latercula]|uniref:RICIN domain-containing protein n=1 Tax=Aquimarina latercula TaxID=987 RepID=UPI00041C191D|nr:RICIN domain-containing protein [Aquimarina latercula]